MAIQMRRGSNAYYDESKMKPGEVAVATDTRQAYVGMGNGDAEELALKRDLEGFDSGTTDHTQLTNRDAADQHPIESIRGLRAELDEQRIIATATGESIVLTDSSDKPLEGLVLYGKTTQNGTPSPASPVPLVSAGNGGSIEVEVCGKNLLKNTANTQTLNGVTFTVSDDGSIKISGTASATTFLNIGNIKLIANQIYVLSGGINSNVSIKWNYKGWTDSGAGSQYRPTEDVTELIVLRIGSGTTVNETIYPMVRLLGLSDATYEPYDKPQTLAISTSNGLPGIPVTSGGNYTDQNGQQWICDEIDFERGVYVQGLATRIFNGSEDGWMLVSAANNAAVIKCSELAGGWSAVYAKSSHFEYSHSKAYKNESGYFAIDEKGMCYFGTGIQALSEFKAWVTGNPFTVICRLAVPIETPLSPEEIAAYKALHSNKPNTTILNDGGAGMSVSYVTDTKAYIDNKFAALQAAILSTGGNV